MEQTFPDPGDLLSDAEDSFSIFKITEINVYYLLLGAGWRRTAQQKSEDQSLPCTGGEGVGRGSCRGGLSNSTGAAVQRPGVQGPKGVQCAQVCEMWGSPGQMVRGLCAGEGSALHPSKPWRAPQTLPGRESTDSGFSFEPVPDHGLGGVLWTGAGRAARRLLSSPRLG